MAQHSPEINALCTGIPCFIPFPWYTPFILLILLLKVCLQRPAGYRNSAIFIAGCSLLVLMSALRWQFDLIQLRQLQSVIAITATVGLALLCLLYRTALAAKNCRFCGTADAGSGAEPYCSANHGCVC
jgi:hypothetical protein